MTIQKVLVIGAGQMGSGIAQVCAQAGFDVKLNDLKQEFWNVASNNYEKFITQCRKRPNDRR